jgi:alpha-tubulin suppressor-like RCC1 family protein
MTTRALVRPALATIALVGSAGCGAMFGVDFDDARPYDDGGAGAGSTTWSTSSIGVTNGAGGSSSTGSSGSGGSGTGGTGGMSAPATAIAAGGLHACALLQGGRVKCWGMNKYGQLGSGNVDSPAPIEPAAIGGSIATGIGAGGFHSCAVLEGGKVTCWGDDSNGQLGDPAALGSGFTQVVGGNAHTCAITTNAGVTCWGSNASGQLGSNAPTGRAPAVVPGLSGVTAITAGAEFTCALAGGGVQCWGSNLGGALGIGSTSPGSVRTPKAAIGLTSGVIAISAADTHACAVKSSGGVACWGSNAWGELGFPNPTEADQPIDVPALASIQSISAGGDAVADDHTCALTTMGNVMCWGINTAGQLGRNATPVGGPVPGAVQGLSDVKALSSGAGFTCALTSAGSVFCWGSNDHRQLGAGATASESSMPTPIAGL